jgi:hypothetical protein
MKSCVQGLLVVAVVALHSMMAYADSSEESWCHIADYLAGRVEGWATLICSQKEHCIEVHGGSPHCEDGELAAWPVIAAVEAAASMIAMTVLTRWAAFEASLVAGPADKSFFSTS